ncbi:MAG: RIP metalloprotease RseP [Alphaproteobacteria bacterium]|nr:RIP metalloprotease RseP [Alphaproteobacteria bacterium]
MLYDSLQTLLAFAVTITIIVFVHEFGHYFVARLSGIKVTDFSIGFGPKIFSRKDSNGTEWKICCIPLGGYVKFLGDLDATSTKSTKLTSEEKKYAFSEKSLLAKSSVAIAGPFANFLFGIIVFATFFFTYGTLVSSTEIQTISSGSPAENIGLRSGDYIVKIEGDKVESFQEVATHISMHPGIEISITVKRNDTLINKRVTPESVEVIDAIGKKNKIGRLGVTFSPPTHKNLPLLDSISKAVSETFRICKLTLKAIGQMIYRERDTQDLGGPIKIARYAGASMEGGLVSMAYFISLLSISIGLINLLPIPPLDGGHLFFYVTEAIFGKKISDYVKNYAIKVGFVLLLALMLLVIMNDIIYF